MPEVRWFIDPLVSTSSSTTPGYLLMVPTLLLSAHPLLKNKKKTLGPTRQS